MTQIALTLTEGVSGDECEAFSLVLDQLPDVEFLHVGARPGPVPGFGRQQHADRAFAEVSRPDVVIVPGGLGCARTARDGQLADWLRQVERSCRWMVASSTGTVVLAAAGLVDDDRPVATHWLATSLLESYGATASRERIVDDGRIITCEGHVTAAEIALILTVRLAGPETARRIRDELPRRRRLAPPRRPGTPRVRVSERPAWWTRLRRRSFGPPPPPANPELQVSEWIDLEPVEMDVIDP